jgi:hypothetical protein
VIAVAYVIRLEDLARDVQSLATGASVAIALGADVPVPDWDNTKASFDAALAAAPAEVRASEDAAGRDDDMRSMKLRALGIAA